jgi:hypothetical protein
MSQIRRFLRALKYYRSRLNGTSSSVDTYDDDDVQWWHYFLGESRSEWDEVQVMALITFVSFVSFVGAVMVWVMFA